MTKILDQVHLFVGKQILSIRNQSFMEKVVTTKLSKGYFMKLCIRKTLHKQKCGRTINSRKTRTIPENCLKFILNTRKDFCLRLSGVFIVYSAPISGIGLTHTFNSLNVSVAII